MTGNVDSQLVFSNGGGMFRYLFLPTFLKIIFGYGRYEILVSFAIIPGLLWMMAGGNICGLQLDVITVHRRS